MLATYFQILQDTKKIVVLYLQLVCNLKLFQIFMKLIFTIENLKKSMRSQV